MPNCDPFCYLSIYLIYSTLFLFYPILSDPIYLFVYYVHTHTHQHTHTHTHTYIYIYIYIYVCVCVCIHMFYTLYARRFAHRHVHV